MGSSWDYPGMSSGKNNGIIPPFQGHDRSGGGGNNSDRSRRDETGDGCLWIVALPIVGLAAVLQAASRMTGG